MIKISDAIKEVIDNNQILRFGFYHHLLNLTQVANFIKPLIESRAKKTVNSSAILMNLSRLQQTIDKISPKIEKYKIENITVSSNMCTQTFQKNPELHEQINDVYKQIQNENGYIVINEGISEITIIFDKSFKERISEKIKIEAIYENNDVSALGIKFDKKYADIPGLLYFLIQQVTLQNINILEVSSTYTQLTLYINQKDTKLAFDTIFNSFN